MDRALLSLEKRWAEELSEEFQKDYFIKLKSFLAAEIQNTEVYPPLDLVFNAFSLTPFDKVKVVIVGQDPYHGPNQAHGLCFSVPANISHPPSLKNIFKELEGDIGVERPKSGTLLNWAKQGVLLLNTTLTVRRKEPLSHYGKGWELFTDRAIEKVFLKKDPVVFILWGKSAQEKCEKVFHKVNDHPHLILCAAHPSFFSAHRGFFGSKHFSKANAFLVKAGKSPINW